MNGSTRSSPEAHRICNLIPSRDIASDWQFDNALAAGALPAVAAPPPSVDLRAPWWAISDQERSGSCVGWASTDGLARYHMVKEGRLGQSDLLSPRATWMASKETDEFVSRPQTFIEEAGTSLKASMEILRKYGAVPESLLPFHLETTMYSGDESTFFAIASKFRISAYYNLGKNFRQWRSWLAGHGPILVGLAVDDTWDNAKATEGNLDSFKPNTVRGGHAVCVIGYTDKGRFILRNSWGTAWGDDGYAYASEAYIQAGFFPESYGVTV